MAVNAFEFEIESSKMWRIALSDTFTSDASVFISTNVVYSMRRLVGCLFAQAKIEDPENNDKFVGSSGSSWLSGVLQRHNLGSLRLHGEGGEVTAEEAEEKMKEFRTNFSDTMEKHDITTGTTAKQSSMYDYLYK